MQTSRCLMTIFALTITLVTATLARADVLIKVNKATQRLTVTVDGVERYQWPVSTARPGYSTPNGVYHPTHLEPSWFSKQYDNAPMPYSIFFHGGYAIHGSCEIKRIGKPASHGCVRLDPKNAKALFEIVKDEGVDKTQVVIEGPPASANRMNVHLAHSSSLPVVGHAPSGREPSAHLAAAKESRVPPHADRAHQGPITTAQTPRFAGPFEALFSFLSNHQDVDGLQVSGKGSAAFASASHTRPKPPQRSLHLVSPEESRAPPHADRAHQGPITTAQTPRFPFYSSIRNYQGIHEARFASEGPAADTYRTYHNSR